MAGERRCRIPPAQQARSRGVVRPRAEIARATQAVGAGGGMSSRYRLSSDGNTTFVDAARHRARYSRPHEETGTF
ncbi:hypothetical protein GCM10009626_22540 [Brachybacterium sacelli]